jgi:hypothetical protein
MVRQGEGEVHEGADVASAAPLVEGEIPRGRKPRRAAASRRCLNSSLEVADLHREESPEVEVLASLSSDLESGQRHEGSRIREGAKAL